MTVGLRGLSGTQLLGASGVRMSRYLGTLYAGGHFTQPGTYTAYGLASWNGSLWMPVGDWNHWASTVAAVYSLVTYQGKLIASGYFGTPPGAPANTYSIAAWDGQAWSGLGSGVYKAGTLPPGLTCKVIDGSLYIYGRFRLSPDGPAFSLARLDGSSWTALPNLGSGSWTDVTIYKGSLYATYSGGSIYRLSGGSWVHPDIPYQLGARLLEYGGLLVSLGYFDRDAGYPENPRLPYSNIVGFDGQDLVENYQGGLTGSPPAQAQDAMIWEGKLLVCGEFSQAGNVAVSNLAIWDGVSWEPFNSPSDDTIYRVAQGNHRIACSYRDFNFGTGKHYHVARQTSGGGWESLGGGFDGVVMALCEM